MEAMTVEFDGIVAAGTFAEVTEIPEGCSIVDAEGNHRLRRSLAATRSTPPHRTAPHRTAPHWLCKWKGDLHGMVTRAKARMVAMGYSQLEGYTTLKRLPLRPLLVLTSS